MEKLMRVLLRVALILAAVVIPIQVGIAGVDIARGWRSAADSARTVIRAEHLDPALLDRIAHDLPKGAPYDVALSGALAQSTRGQAFAALLRTRLLPRLQVTDAHRAKWHVRWGVAGAADCCRRSIFVGRPDPADPPVLILESR